MQTSAAAATRIAARRPLRELLEGLPRLPVNAASQIDFAAADPRLLVALGEDADTIAGVAALGVGAVGSLLSESSVAIEDGTIGADVIESLGHLLAELGDLAAFCMTLNARCKVETSDFSPS